MDEDPPPEPPKPKTNKSRELAGIETSLEDAWMPPAQGNSRNRVGKDTLAVSAQLALKDEEFENMIPIYATTAISDNHGDGINDPKSYKAATKSPLTDKWDMAMKEELNGIGQHQVFGDFVELREGRKALPSHWVYKIKRDGAGNVQQYKARLVCGENHQIEGIDYQAMYAPTARFGHIRLALAIAAKYDLEIHQMDVCTAFLEVNIEEEIYLHPPQEYFRLFQTGRLTTILRKMALHLRKPLYGLKQSSHSWYSTFRDFLMSIGFVAPRVDGGQFVLYNRDQDIGAAIVLYVDYLLIIANDGLIGQIKDQMKKRFRMHHLGSVSFYLGMHIKRNRDHHAIDIHLHSYIPTIFAKFRMDKSRPVAMPMAMKLHNRKPDKEACYPTIYQSMIGSLTYAMTGTHPGISYAIGVLSRYNHDRSNEHMVALRHVFLDLNRTKNWRLCFGRALGEALEGEGALRCHANSDCAGCPDDYKSTCGLVITFGGAVDWSSRMQKSTAQSTTNAEYYTFGVGRMRLTQISHLLNELGIPTIPHVVSDSQSLIASIKIRIFDGTAVVHIATKYSLAADMATDGEIDLSYIPTAEMLADYFRKPLPKPALSKQCAAMEMIGIGLWNGLRNGLGNRHRNGPGNGIGIGIGHGIGNAVGR